MSYNSADIRLEMAFGKGPRDTILAGDWTDVTSFLDLDGSSPAITTTSGRTSVRAGIDPGSMSFRLDNSDGRWNPRNSSGPYFGNLKNGVPVRVTTTYASVTHVRWMGFVSDGWPQTLSTYYPTVTLKAHDLVGLLAQSDTPATAFDALLASWPFAPAHIFEPGPDGWMDRVTGRVHRHTGILQEDAGDPIIDGAEKPWGQTDPDGFGFSSTPADYLNPTVEATTVLARVKLPTVAQRNVGAPGATDPIVILGQDDTAAGFPPFRLVVYVDSIEVICYGSGGARQGFTTVGEAEAVLMDGEPHTVVAHVPASTGNPRIWVDGRELALVQFTNAVAYSITPGFLYLGDGGPRFFDSRPFSGVIDPIVVWRAHPAGATLESLAKEFHDAATLAWAGDSMDGRIVRILAAVGLTAHQGALDVSGITTRQGYRQSGALELLQTIEDTEQGRVWVDRQGDLRFSARRWAWTDSRSVNVQVTFSDNGTLIQAGTAEEMLEAGTVITDDPRTLVNVAQVTSEYGRQQTVVDQASVTEYGRQVVTLSNLLHGTDRESRTIAEWLVLSQGDPQVRVEKVSFWVENRPTTLAPLAQVIDQGDRVRVRKTMPAGPEIDVQGHVIGVENEFSFRGWRVTLYLDGTRANRSFFTWGTSTWGGSSPWAF